MLTSFSLFIFTFSVSLYVVTEMWPVLLIHFNYWQNLKKIFFCWCSPLLQELFSWNAKIYWHLASYILQLTPFITPYSNCSDIGGLAEPNVFCRYCGVNVWCPSYSSLVVVEWKHSLNIGIQLCMAWNLYQFICSWHLLFTWGLDLYVNCVLRLLIFLFMPELPLLWCVLGNAAFGICVGWVFHNVCCAVLSSQVSVVMQLGQC